MELDLRAYRRDCWLGALGAHFMLAGDLCLSVIPATAGDSGLFLREAYLSGGYEPWRMLVFHMLVWQIIFVLIPDLRQLLGAQISTWDFVCSQGSGNASLCIWPRMRSGQREQTEEADSCLKKLPLPACRKPCCRLSRPARGKARDAARSAMKRRSRSLEVLTMIFPSRRRIRPCAAA